MGNVVEPTAETLAGVVILSELDARTRAELARHCRGRRWAAQQQIVHHQDRSTDAYFVISGRVRVTIHARSGKEVAFRDLGAGQVFGELSAIDGEPRSASVIALEDSLLVTMPAKVFRELLREHPDVASSVLCQLTALVRSLSDRVVEYSTLGVNNRIHAELLRLARDGGCSENASLIAPVPTHAEIASRVSSHREAVTRELSRLGRAGLLSRDSDGLRIHDVARLERMVETVKGE